MDLKWYCPLLLTIIVLINGCSLYKTDVSVGYPGPGASTLSPPGETSHIFKQTISAGRNLYNGPIIVDGFLGGSFIRETDTSALGYSAETNLRAGYPVSNGIMPYIDCTLGFAYFDPRIKEQATNWGFIINPNIGLRFKLTESLYIYGQYGVWHFSNGSSIFGSPKPNHGINTDLVSLGIEVKF